MGFLNYDTSVDPFLSFIKLLFVGDPMGVEDLNRSTATTAASSSLTNSLTQLNHFSENGSNQILNASWKHPEEYEIVHRSLQAQIATAFAYIMLAICGVIGNSLVIFAVLQEPILQIKNQLSNMTIINLAFTDLATATIVCIPAAIAVIYDAYPFPNFFCRFWTFVNVTTIVATMFTLAVISGDRFIAVKWSLHYPQWVTQHRMMMACFVVWIVSALCALGWVIDESWITFDYESGICDIRWASIQPIPVAFYWGLFCSIFFFILPTSCIFCLNAAIIFLSKEKRRVGILHMTVDNKKKSKGGDPQFNAKILKSMLIVIVTYLLLNVPVALIRVTRILGGHGVASLYPTWLTTLCNIFQFLASIVNPLIYGLFRKDFKDSYVKIGKKLVALLFKRK